MDKKFILTTLLLGSLISLTTTGCFQKAQDTSMDMEEPTKMEQEAQPACQIEEKQDQQEQEKTEESKMESEEEVLK